MKKVLVLYVPVLHAGYLKLFGRYKNTVDALYILGAPFVRELSPFLKEIRAIEPATAQKLIAGLGIFKRVEIINPALDRRAFKGGVNRKLPPELRHAEIITADEEVSRAFAKKYLKGSRIRYERIFLRWDEKKVKSGAKVKYSRVSSAPFDKKMVERASCEADKSSDWWRQVGAVVVRNKKVILEAHNRHVPSEHKPYAEGDPRDVIEPGVLNLLYTSIHAEQAVIAEAARRGISLKGASIYMNIFPCPLCAKLVAYSGIKKCYFRTGSAWLDAESILKAKGVEIIRVK